jgi:outer membrane cobalamin receptor
MNEPLRKLSLVFVCILCAMSVRAQTDTLQTRRDTVSSDSLSYYDMTIEQLLNLKAHGVPSELEKLINSLISVASKRPLNVRESPSIVSLITAEEIKASGARDLIDVLRLVPGVDFGMDVLGTVGIGMRGNWAHEGKTLVLIDGQEMNEILFGTTQYGNHFAIDQIKKIEIIRGPGSAIYGGYAEYGVVNIITRQGEDINGISASAIYGTTQKDYMRRNLNLSAGKKIGDFEWSLSGMIGQGQRSDQDYTDIYDSTINLAGNSKLDPAYVNFGAAWKGLSVRAIGDFYKTTTMDGNDFVLPRAYIQDFSSQLYELKYAWKISEKLTITPKLNYKYQVPWETPDGDSLNATYEKYAKRSTANLTASYTHNRNINVVLGGEFYRDYAIDKNDTFYNGKDAVDFNNLAVFTQGLWKTRLVNFILGARYDKNSAYGDAFVPRVGLTKKFFRFHFKALYSNSFRAPSIENINYSLTGALSPEKTQVAELEMGYQVTRKSIITVNFFDITTRNPIVYFFDANANTDAYLNANSTGTLGAEAEYKIKGKWGYAGINYSFYTSAGKTRIDAYRVPDDSAALLGFANHKVNFYVTYNLSKKFSVNASATYYGERNAYTSVDTAYVPLHGRTPSKLLVNLFLNYAPVKGLTIGAGVFDLLDQKFTFIQPYSNALTPGHAPLPAPPREFVFRISYDLPIGKK